MDLQEELNLMKGRENMLRSHVELLCMKQETANAQIQDLINYNTKLPNDINKYFKMLKNQLEDLQDQVDRIEEIVDVKITSKQEMTRLKQRVKTIEDELTSSKSKCLDIEDHMITIEKSMFRNITQHEIQYQELLTNFESIQKPAISRKLQSDINNTKYSIKKLTEKMNEGTITEKESKRLDYKKNLLEQLMTK